MAEITESRLLIPLLLLLQLLASTAPLPTISIASAWPIPQTNNQSTEPSLMTSQQFTNIVEALVGASDFSDWASALSVSDPSTFPITATLFVPTNPNPNPNFFTDPTLMAFHTVPQRLAFSNLLELPTHSLLPTLLPNKSIEITSNSTLNFTIEGRRITRHDAVVSGPFVVHGIDSVLPLKGFGISDGDGDGLDESQSCCSVGGIGRGGGGGAAAGGGVSGVVRLGFGVSTVSVLLVDMVFFFLFVKD